MFLSEAQGIQPQCAAAWHSLGTGIGLANILYGWTQREGSQQLQVTQGLLLKPFYFPQFRIAYVYLPNIEILGDKLFFKCSNSAWFLSQQNNCCLSGRQFRLRIAWLGPQAGAIYHPYLETLSLLPQLRNTFQQRAVQVNGWCFPVFSLWPNYNQSHASSFQGLYIINTNKVENHHFLSHLVTRWKKMKLTHLLSK